MVLETGSADGMKEPFWRGPGKERISHEDEIKRPQAKIGELVLERDFLSKAFDR